MRQPWNKQLGQRVRIVVFGRLSVSQRVEYFASTLAHWVHMGMPSVCPYLQHLDKPCTVWHTYAHTHTHYCLEKHLFHWLGCPAHRSTAFHLSCPQAWVEFSHTSRVQSRNSNPALLSSSQNGKTWWNCVQVLRQETGHVKFCIRLGSRPWGCFGDVAAQLIKVPVEFEFNKLWQKSTSMVP